MEGYAVFRKFPDMEQAQELVATLESHGIEAKLLDNSPDVDITFSGNTLQNEVQVFVKQDDFDQAYDLMEKLAVNMLDETDADHYLFEFTDKELFEVLEKPDEWSSFDHQLAQKILKDRGQNVNDELVNSLRKQRIEELAKPERSAKKWIYLGYSWAVLGGLFGMIIGWQLMNQKKTLPDGRKVYAYSEGDRVHGRFMFRLGAISLPIWYIIRLLIQP